MPFGSEGVQLGIGLAVSGGGFRATLFHIGSLWRLNELGYLPKIDRFSSVSGGSITMGLLALSWSKLTYVNEVATNIRQEVFDPLREFCARDIDAWAIGEGALLPWKSTGEAIQEEYEKHLFGKATLQDLPDKPRFVINATNFQTGNSFRFSKPYAGDYRLGLINNPKFRLALAVTASSAFPPFLSPVEVEVPAGAFQPVKGSDLNGVADFTEELFLTDGGVYDNLGLETVWNRYDTVLTSDAGAPLSTDKDVETSWYGQALRALDITTNQARALRKRALVDDFIQNRRKGTYWGIRTDIAKYEFPDALPCDRQKILALASLRTRLNTFSEAEQSELINWGYAVCDAAMQRHVIPAGSQLPKAEWPYPGFKVA
jgi:NTE family protein